MIGQIKTITGKKGFYCIVVSIFLGGTLGGVELIIGGLLQSLFLKLDLIPSSGVNMLFDPRLISVGLLSLLLFLAALVRGIASFLCSQLSKYASEGINFRLRIQSLHDLVMQSNPYVSSGDIGYRVSEIIPGTVSFVDSLARLTTHLAQSTVLLILMSFQTQYLTMIGLICLGLSGILMYLLNILIKKSASTMPNIQKKVFQSVDHVSVGIMLIRVFRTQKLEYQNLKALITEAYNKSIRISALHFISAQLPSICGVAILVLLLNFNTLNLINLMIFIYLFLRLVQSLTGIAQYAGKVFESLPNFQIATHYWQSKQAGFRPDMPLHFFGSNHSPTPSQQTYFRTQIENRKPPRIDLINLSFYYDDRVSLFTKVRLSMSPGSQTVFYGGSGSGKSTLLNLILGFLKPVTGKVYIDGQDSGLFTSDPNVCLGYVGPEPMLIKGTIRDNLLYGAVKQHSDEDIFATLKKLSLTEFTSNQGLNRNVTAIGKGLSIGQKQRLALARSLINMPCLLILDELTANLDEETEKIVIDSLRPLKGICTVLIVTHRSRLFEDADKTYELRHGTIIDRS